MPMDSGTASHTVLAPSSVGNLGDEAMLTSAIRNIRERSTKPIVVLTHKDDDDWSHIDPEIRQVSLEGFFSPLSWRRAADTLLSQIGTSSTFNVLGADIMDGAYSASRTFRRLLMLELAASRGVDSAILGFSYSDKANPESVRYLQSFGGSVTKYARDPGSHARLEAISPEGLHLVADTAFLLKPSQGESTEVRRIVSAIEQARADGKRVIAFNANPLGAAMSAGAKRGNESVSELDGIVVRNVEAILRSLPDVHLVFVSHDPREPHNDARLLESVFARLSPELSSRITLATRGIGARDVKLLCSMTDLVVTGRMHMGIAALGSGTPCYFLDFQGKVRGLLEHFGIAEMCCGWDVYSDAKRYAESVVHFLNHRDDYRAKLHAELPRIREMAARNFERFGQQSNTRLDDAASR